MEMIQSIIVQMVQSAGVVFGVFIGSYFTFKIFGTPIAKSFDRLTNALIEEIQKGKLERSAEDD